MEPDEGAGGCDDRSPDVTTPNLREERRRIKTITSLVSVSTSRFRTLRALFEARRTASELARELDLNKSTVHGYLQEMVEDGLIERLEDGDRLWVYYRLTPWGERLAGADRVSIVVELDTED